MTLHHTFKHQGRARGIVYILLFMSLFALSGDLFAQAPAYYIGLPSATSGVGPIFWYSATANKGEWRYLANSFNGTPGAGYISKVWWRAHVHGSGVMTLTNLQIWIGQVNSTFSTAPTAWATGLTLAYSSATATIPIAPGNSYWYGWTLQNPVPYNPNQAIIIQVCKDNVTGVSGTNTSSFQTAAFNSFSIGTTCAAAGITNNTYMFDFGFDLGGSPSFNDASISSLLAPVNLLGPVRHQGTIDELRQAESELLHHQVDLRRRTAA